MSEAKTAIVIKKIDYMEPCDDAMRWLYYNSHKSPEQLWEECPRADWLVWLIKQLPTNRSKKEWVELSAKLARTTIHLVPPEEKRPRRHLGIVERWLDGKAEIEECRRDLYYESKTVSTAIIEKEKEDPVVYNATFAVAHTINAASTSTSSHSIEKIISRVNTFNVAYNVTRVARATKDENLRKRQANIVREYFSVEEIIRALERGSYYEELQSMRRIRTRI